MQDILDVLHGILTRTNTRNKPALTLKVFRSVFRIENNRGVEVCEEHNEQRSEDPVHPTCRNSVGSHGEPINIEQSSDLRREINQAACKDDRNNTCSVDLDGKVRALTAHNLTTLNALCITNWDTTLSTLHEDNRRDAKQYHNQNKDGYRNAHTHICIQVDRREDSRRNRRDDRHEDDQRHAIANTMLSDELAHPHDQSSANY